MASLRSLLDFFVTEFVGLLLFVLLGNGEVFPVTASMVGRAEVHLAEAFLHVVELDVELLGLAEAAHVTLAQVALEDVRLGLGSALEVL